MMKMKTIDSSLVMVSPAKAIRRFEDILVRDGKKRALESSSFQKIRELWIAGVFTLCYSQLTKRKYWVQENPQTNNAPDVFVYSYRDPKGVGEIGVVKEQIPIEICEYTVHSGYGLSDHINKKLENKKYSKETWLLCYIQRPGDELTLTNVFKELKHIQTTVREIWLLYDVAGRKPGDVVIDRCYFRGEKNKNDVLIRKEGNYMELMKIPQEEFLQDKLGMTKTVTIAPGKKVIVPLPKDHVKVENIKKI